MSVTVIDNFEFDVELLVNEFNTFIAPHMYHHSIDHPNVLVEEYKKFIAPAVWKPLKYHPDYLATQQFKLIEHYDRIHEVIENMQYTQEIIKRVKPLYDFSDVIYRAVLPGKEYIWHTDSSWSEFDHNYHIPLITNINCNFMYVDKIYPMPAGKLYKSMVNRLHTFKNGGTETRVHLTFERMKKTNSDAFTKRTFDNN